MSSVWWFLFFLFFVFAIVGILVCFLMMPSEFFLTKYSLIWIGLGLSAYTVVCATILFTVAHYESLESKEEENGIPKKEPKPDYSIQLFILTLYCGIGIWKLDEILQVLRQICRNGSLAQKRPLEDANKTII